MANWDTVAKLLNLAVLLSSLELTPLLNKYQTTAKA
jgi:hypothetical protein